MAIDDANAEGAVLVGAYDPDRIGHVRAALAELGVPDDVIHVEERPDEQASLRAEQVEEVDRALVAPQVGVAVPKEAAKAMMWTMPAAGAVGAVVGALIALIPLDAMSFPVRLFWFCLIGIVAATTIAYVATSAMAVKDPFVAGAAQRGVVVRVDDTRAEVCDRLADLHPLRLDVIARDGSVLRTIRTEEDEQPGGALEELAHNVEREERATPTERHR